MSVTRRPYVWRGAWVNVPQVGDVDPEGYRVVSVTVTDTRIRTTIDWLSEAHREAAYKRYGWTNGSAA